LFKGFYFSLTRLDWDFWAIALGLVVFKFGVKLNIRVFFKVLGIILILIISALVMTTAIAQLVSTPNEPNLKAAQDAWILARVQFLRSL
jgi:hypothetical protein